MSPAGGTDERVLLGARLELRDEHPGQRWNEGVQPIVRGRVPVVTSACIFHCRCAGRLADMCHFGHKAPTKVAEENAGGEGTARISSPVRPS